jgi:nucleotide-binding universal stress UspA family protein
MTGRIVVGVDGVSEHLAPVEWGYREAARRGAVLDLVHAWDLPLEISPLGIPGELFDPDALEQAAKQRLFSVVDSIAPALREKVASVNLLTPCGGTSRALLEASATADMLVVGQRGRGAVRGLLGSVSHQCLHHRRCPIAVISAGSSSAEPLRTIVVGVDGSEGSAAALRWAMNEAALWNALLTVVRSWPTPYPVEPWGVVVRPDDRDLFVEEGRSLIDKMVTTAESQGAPRPPDLTPLPLEDAAGPALVEASAAADLLVVGSRGRGGFAALLLGSTGLHCVHHAECPVAVIPPTAA